MEKIQLRDINFSLLKKLNEQGTKSTIYTDDNICYKILDDLSPEEKESLYRKILDMDGLKLDNVILPIDLIVQNNKLEGYTMKYFKNSKALYDIFSGRYIDSKKLFEYLIKASCILRQIHQNGIICQDLNFGNILIDNNGAVAFCDFDSYSYKDHESPFISLRLKQFIRYYRKEEICVDRNLDRISMLLSLYDLIYLKQIQRIFKSQHKMLAEHLLTFRNCSFYVQDLVNKKCKIPQIPYLDELIDPSDEYVIDRDKVLTLFDKVFLR